MKNVAISVIAILIFLFFGCSPENRQNPGKIKIATFNCYFLWDGIEPEEGNPAVEFPHKDNPGLAKEHMREIAGVIKEIDPDIINLVEVENLEALQLLNDSFLHGLNYNIGFVKGIDTYTGQDVAVLSRFPIENIFRYAGKGKSGPVEKSVSKNYVADIRVGNKLLTVIGLHLLARPYDASRINERQAQADAIRKIAIEKISAGHEIIVLGDFNDYDGDSCCSDVLDNIPVTKVLPDLKAMDYDNVQDDLLNLSAFIHKDERYTSHWDKDGEGDVDHEELSSIDHILFSNSLSLSLKNAYVYHDFNPIDVSDHFPVVAEFEFE